MDDRNSKHQHVATTCSIIRIMCQLTVHTVMHFSWFSFAKIQRFGHNISMTGHFFAMKSGRQTCATLHDSYYLAPLSKLNS